VVWDAITGGGAALSGSVFCFNTINKSFYVFSIFFIFLSFQAKVQQLFYHSI